MNSATPADGAKPRRTATRATPGRTGTKTTKPASKKPNITFSARDFFESAVRQGRLEAEVETLQDAIKHIDKKFDKVDERFTRVDERFARVDERFDKVDERFARVDERFDKVDERFARVDERFDKVVTLLFGLYGFVAIALGLAVAFLR